jgi:Flp pilus assembly protein TadD
LISLTDLGGGARLDYLPRMRLHGPLLAAAALLLPGTSPAQRLPVPGEPSRSSASSEINVIPDANLEEIFRTEPVVPHRFRDTANRANEMVKSGRLAEAAALYEQILKAHPKSLFALSNLGVVHFRLGNFPEARKCLEAALQGNPRDAFSLSILGITCYKLGLLSLSVQHLNDAIRIDPTDPRTHNYMGIVSSKKGWWRAAEDECRRAVQLDPRYADPHYNLALIYANRPSPDMLLAREAYTKALKLGYPPSPELEAQIGYKPGGK